MGPLAAGRREARAQVMAVGRVRVRGIWAGGVVDVERRAVGERDPAHGYALAVTGLTGHLEMSLTAGMDGAARHGVDRGAVGAVGE